MATGLAMAESNRTTVHLDALVARIEGLVNSISDRDKLVAAMKAQIDGFQEKAERNLNEKYVALEAKLDESLSDELRATVDYTKDLYTRFERMIWLGMLLLAAIAASIGYQTFSSIPDQIAAQIKARATSHESTLEANFAKHKKDLETQLTTARKELADFNDHLKESRDRATRLVTDEVNKITVNYGTGFRDFNVDVWVQTLQRRPEEIETAEIEIVRQLLGIFRSIDFARQARVAATLAARERELPSDVVTLMRNAMEPWDTSKSPESAPIRLQLLVRHGSNAGPVEAQNRMTAAVKAADHDAALATIRIIWQAFTGGRSLAATGAAGSDSPGDRRRGESQRSVREYLPVFQEASKVQALTSRIAPLLLEIRNRSDGRNAEFDRLLAMVLTGADDDTQTMVPFFVELPRFPVDAQLYKASVEYIVRSFDRSQKLPSRLRANIGPNLFAFALRNSGSLKNDEKLRSQTSSLLEQFKAADSLSQLEFNHYFASGGTNVFAGGARLPLTEDSGLQRQIREIQFRDQSWTALQGFKQQDAKSQGLPVTVTGISIDGRDGPDLMLGVEVKVLVGDQEEALRFLGNEKFSLSVHPREIGPNKLRFALEMRDQNLALMIGLAK